MGTISEGDTMQIEQEITDDMIQTIANNAVRETQQKSLDNGIPNAYSKNGTDCYQLTDNMNIVNM